MTNDKKNSVTNGNDSLPSKETSFSNSIAEQDQMTGIEEKTSRRRVLRNTLIGGGAVLSTSIVPDKWKTPLLNSVILPSHAQTSVVTVVMGGGPGISVVKADDSGIDVDDILDIFISQAYAGAVASTAIDGGCLLLTIEGSVATVELTLNDLRVDTQSGTVSGTTVTVTGLHSGYTVNATLDSATAPTSCSGSVSGFGENGTFSVSSADPVCAAVTTTTTVAPTTTAAPTTTVMPTTTLPPNSNVTFNFSLSKSQWS